MKANVEVLDDISDVRSISVSDVPSRPEHSTVVMVDPAFFARDYVINPYMAGDVNEGRAREQWERLRTVYETYLDDVQIVDPEETWRALPEGTDGKPPSACPDMVFVANHGVPTADGEGFVLARMATEERAGEPAYFKEWAEDAGYRVASAPSATFEGMGDALWHPGRRLLWAGHGVRSDRAAYDELATRLDATVVPLELTDERYYHLDVCFAPLSESTVLIQPDAFTADGREKITSLFEEVLEAPGSEATDDLAVNVEVLGETVVLGASAPRTAELLESAGFDVVTVDTSEFQKAGGSVCCLTLSAGSPS